MVPLSPCPPALDSREGERVARDRIEVGCPHEPLWIVGIGIESEQEQSQTGIKNGKTWMNKE